MPEFRTEPLIVPTVSGLLPEGERNRRVALTSLPTGRERLTVPQREVCCYECGKSSQVPAAALTAQCRHCRAHLNMGNVELKAGARRLTVRTLGDVSIASDAVLSHLSIVCRNLSVNGRGNGSFRCSGRLSFGCSLTVEGSVSAETLSVARGCEVTLEQVAQVKGEAHLAGKLRGKMKVQGGITIARGGVLTGDCSAASLTIEPGGRHDGRFTPLA